MASQSEGSQVNEETIIQTLGYYRQANGEKLDYVIAFDPLLLAAGQTLATEGCLPGSDHALPCIFDRLPNEIMIKILVLLDIESYRKFRQVNRQARSITAGVTMYKSIVKYAPTCLLAMIRTGLARWYTLDDIHVLMFKNRCNICGGGSDYVNLMAKTRICRTCLHWSHEGFFRQRYVTMASFLRQVGTIKEGQLRRQIPVMRVLKGQYNSYKPLDRRYNLIDVHLANTITNGNANPTYGASIDSLGRMMSAPLPFYQGPNRDIATFACKGCAWVGCRLSYDPALTAVQRSQMCRRLFTRAGLLQHIPGCVGARRLWAMSMGGTASIHHQMNKLKEIEVSDD